MVGSVCIYECKHACMQVNRADQQTRQMPTQSYHHHHSPPPPGSDKYTKHTHRQKESTIHIAMRLKRVAD